MDWIYNNYALFFLIGGVFAIPGLYYIFCGLGYSSRASREFLEAGLGTPPSIQYKSHKHLKSAKLLSRGIILLMIACAFFIIGTPNTISTQLYGALLPIK